MSEEFGKSSLGRFSFGFLRSTLNCRLLTSFIHPYLILTFIADFSRMLGASMFRKLLFAAPHEVFLHFLE